MTVEQWSAAVGFVLPLLVSLINREEWKPQLKALIVVLSSVAVGTITALIHGDFTGANWAGAIGIVFVSSQVAYKAWWKKSEVTAWIEEKINIVGGKEAPPEDETEEPSGTVLEPNEEVDESLPPVQNGRHAAVEEDV